ncbi:MAG: ComF family protein [Gemmatimonadales bacterium]
MRRWTADWVELAERVERWLLPPECLACRRALPPGVDDLVCGVCRSRWRAVPDPICPRCGTHAPLRLSCRVCPEWPPEFGPVRSAAHLDAGVRMLVHHFKYQGWQRLAASFALRMAPLVQAIDPADLVPIPLSRRRRRQRGYNQAEELAVEIGRLVDYPVRPARLRRLRDTPTQTALTAEERQANLAAAFAAAGERPAILIDDVFTTGATLVSAATALLAEGVPWVAAVTFARA